MAYGTEPFTDGYGDYKQPTIVDYDKRVNNTFGKNPHNTSKEEKERIFSQYEEDQKDALQQILETNPVFAGEIYQHLTQAVNGKLVWNVDKINELKINVDWLYMLRRWLDKQKELFHSK